MLKVIRSVQTKFTRMYDNRQQLVAALYRKKEYWIRISNDRDKTIITLNNLVHMTTVFTSPIENGEHQHLLISYRSIIYGHESGICTTYRLLTSWKIRWLMMRYNQVSSFHDYIVLAWIFVTRQHWIKLCKIREIAHA
jgi:hypothetical protein